MRICVFEDESVDRLEPLTLTRPTFDLWCGAGPLLHRHMRAFATAAVGVLVRPALVALCRLRHPELAVNDSDWLRCGPVVWVNGRWLPAPEGPGELDEPHVGLAVDGQLAYALPPAGEQPANFPGGLPEALERWQRQLPHRAAGGRLLSYPWDLVEATAAALVADHPHWRWKRDFGAERCGACVVGPAEQLVVAAGAVLEPLVVVDTTRGPVLIDRQAKVEAFSRLEGPCYIGVGTRVHGARLSGSSVGPHCRVAGEVESSVIQGYSNKAHDGFLGHSYLGEWVNLGACTQVADLRTDYRTVSVVVGGELVDTGLLKVGAFVGDHTRTGLDTLLDAGSVVGAFARLLPWGPLAPRFIPSFSRFRDGQLAERSDLRALFATARVALGRRNAAWTEAHEELFFDLYERTVDCRRKVTQGDPLRCLCPAH